MKIKVKQIWDMEIKPWMTLDDARNILIGAELFYKDDDIFITNKNGKLIIRRIAK